jgi:hypothetical protein
MTIPVTTTLGKLAIIAITSLRVLHLGGRALRTQRGQPRHHVDARSELTSLYEPKRHDANAAQP